MSDILYSQIDQATSNVSGATSNEADFTLGSANESDVNQFQQAMTSEDGLGKSIVSELVDMKDKFKGAVSNLEKAMSSRIDDPSALMQMQWSLTRITMQEELIAKTAGKTTQNIETLIKAQ